MTCAPCLVLGVIFLAPKLHLSSATCAQEKLAVYNLKFEANWGEDNFPKQYPLWRPPAQWSKTVGFSHGTAMQLFSIGSMANPGVKQFIETGQSDILDKQSSEEAFLDSFTVPPIQAGKGNSSSLIFVDGTHSKVSLISKLVPSPDWFVGLDSVDLCQEGQFIETISLKVNPLDGGTDNGFTFTSPNWPTEPQGTVFEIKSDYPVHPAGSFHYPHLKELPTIAVFSLTKEREYTLQEKTENMKTGTSLQEKSLPKKNLDLEYVPVKKSKVSNTKSFRNSVSSNVGYHASSGPENFFKKKYKSAHLTKANQIILNKYSSKNKLALKKLMSTFPKLSRKKNFSSKRKFKTKDKPEDCMVSGWSKWGHCSKSCGIGETLRTRSVKRHPKHRGKDCPQLKEFKWCGSARNCNEGYFDW